MGVAALGADRDADALRDALGRGLGATEDDADATASSSSDDDDDDDAPAELRVAWPEVVDVKWGRVA